MLPSEAGIDMLRNRFGRHVGIDPRRRVRADRRDTLVAKKIAIGVYRFDIHLQGGNETVFFGV